MAEAALNRIAHKNFFEESHSENHPSRYPSQEERRQYFRTDLVVEQ